MAGPLELLGKWLKKTEQFGNLAPVILERTFDLHKGTKFEGSWFFSGTVAGAREQVLLLCHEDYDCRAIMHMASNVDTLLEIYENPSINVTGTEQTPRNLNRTFGRDGFERARTRGFVTPALAVDGYLLSHQFLPAGAGDVAGANKDGEWVLRRGQAYVFRMYNWDSTNAGVVGMRITWGEDDFSAAIDGS